MGKSRFWRSELWENYVFLGRSKNHIFEVGIMGKPKITFFEVGRRCFLKVIIIGRSCGEKGRSFKMGSLNIPIYHWRTYISAWWTLCQSVWTVAPTDFSSGPDQSLVYKIRLCQAHFSFFRRIQMIWRIFFASSCITKSSRRFLLDGRKLLSGWYIVSLSVIIRDHQILQITMIIKVNGITEFLDISDSIQDLIDRTTGKTISLC